MTIISLMAIISLMDTPKGNPPAWFRCATCGVVVETKTLKKAEAERDKHNETTGHSFSFVMASAKGRTNVKMVMDEK